MLPLVVKQTMDMLCEQLVQNNIKVESIMLYGSVALLDYVEGTSDIDFIVILSEKATDEQIEMIRAAHEYVENILPNSDIMGAYLLENDLGKDFSNIDHIVTYYNKRLHTNGEGADLNPITWWILKHNAITVYGRQLEIKYDVTSDELKSFVIYNLNSYWAGWIEKIEYQLANYSVNDENTVSPQIDDVVEWCTLGTLRQYYTIVEGSILSKRQAGYYAIKRLSERWHNLIKEAIQIKGRHIEQRFYQSDRERVSDLLDLLKFIHTETNRIYSENRSLA